MWTRAELKDNAKKFFRFNYWKMVLVSFVLIIVSGGGAGGGGMSTADSEEFLESTGIASMPQAQLMQFVMGFLVAFTVVMVIAFVMSAFLFNPLIVGAQRFFVVSHYRKAELGEMGFAFSNRYMNIVKVMFLRSMYTFFWTLLFIVPGIIKAYEYRMIPYILAENPGIDSREAFAMSRQMMDGNKWDAFVLDLSFLGWNILSVFTCGILSVFYVNPYIYMTDAELYVALKEITYGGPGANYYQDPNTNRQSWNGQQYQNGNQQYWN